MALLIINPVISMIKLLRKIQHSHSSAGNFRWNIIYGHNCYMPVGSLPSLKEKDTNINIVSPHLT